MHHNRERSATQMRAGDAVVGYGNVMWAARTVCVLALSSCVCPSPRLPYTVLQLVAGEPLAGGAARSQKCTARRASDPILARNETDTATHLACVPNSHQDQAQAAARLDGRHKLRRFGHHHIDGLRCVNSVGAARVRAAAGTPNSLQQPPADPAVAKCTCNKNRYGHR